MDNTLYVESITAGNALHDLLQHMNGMYGQGHLVSLTWSTECMPGKWSKGIVVCQKQYGMCARTFRIMHAADGFTIFYAGHQKSVVSAYFIPF